jgi:hypothetical protein
MVFKCVMDVAIDLRKKLTENIILAGGNTLFSQVPLGKHSTAHARVGENAGAQPGWPWADDVPEIEDRGRGARHHSQGGGLEGTQPRCLERRQRGGADAELRGPSLALNCISFWPGAFWNQAALTYKLPCSSRASHRTSS